MDALYILGTGSVWKNQELRYSLRSLERHVRGIDRVFVVGENPEFLSDRVEYKCFQDPTDNREYNIASKILWTCDNAGISENFLFINDDHIFLDSVDAVRYPYYHAGPLDGAVERAKHSRYRQSLKNTLGFLSDQGVRLLHYDIHVPIIYNREQFKALSPVWDRSKRQVGNNGFVVKSTYANLSGVTPGPRIHDCKLVSPKGKAKGLEWVRNRVTDRHIFSFGDAAIMQGVGEFLKLTFPIPSKFESGYSRR